MQRYIPYKWNRILHIAGRQSAHQKLCSMLKKGPCLPVNKPLLQRGDLVAKLTRYDRTASDTHNTAGKKHSRGGWAVSYVYQGNKTIIESKNWKILRKTESGTRKGNPRSLIRQFLEQQCAFFASLCTYVRAQLTICKSEIRNIIENTHYTVNDGARVRHQYLWKKNFYGRANENVNDTAVQWENLPFKVSSY